MHEEEREQRKGLSFRAKNTLVFVSLFALLIGSLWLINRFMLQKYYLKHQLEDLENVRLMLEKLIQDSSDEELRLELTRKCESSGIAASLKREDAQGVPVILFMAGGERAPWGGGKTRSGMNPPPQTIYKETDHYIVTLIQDPFTKTDKIECRGVLTEKGEEYEYFLGLPMAKIAENVSISNRFLLIIGSGILVLGALLVFFFTDRMSRPLETMSTTLDATVEDLKRANLALEEDVRKKEEENQRRKELLANISHELKTPIALVQGYAEGLRDGLCEDEESRIRYSDTIADEAERMNRLVRVLLSLDEMESGQMEIEKSRFDLAEVIRGMTETFRLKGKGQPPRWELVLPETLPIESDELMVEQILQNYLSNAVNHVTEGGLIRVSAAPEGEGARVEVFNEGKPIPEEALGQIWNKFYKVDKARTRSYGGSGIGLSVVKAATELIGGSCGVENRENGVCFTLRL